MSVNESNRDPDVQNGAQCLVTLNAAGKIASSIPQFMGPYIKTLVHALFNARNAMIDDPVIMSKVSCLVNL
jgi:hypothetical protein